MGFPRLLANWVVQPFDRTGTNSAEAYKEARKAAISEGQLHLPRYL